MSLPYALPLNHFYVVLDSATYKAIEQSSFLRREFAVTEQRTTTRTDITYTGLYFYGANTYFEFFDESSRAFGQVGDCGVAFGTDQAGASNAIKTELGSEFSVGEAPVTRQFNQKQVPWFYMAVPRNFPLTSGIRPWVMEYHPLFLSEWNPQFSNEGISRKQILQRYAAVLKEKPAEPYFEDVIELTIAIDESTQKKLVKLCNLLGYGERIEPAATVLKGPDMALRLTPQADKARGIQKVTMRIRRRPEGRTELRFGSRSVLKFGDGGLASWSF
jgi:hypothetical protein